MSTNRPTYSAYTNAGRNCIGAPRDDVGLNAQGVPRVTDPGPYSEGAYATTTADTLNLTPAMVEPVTFVYDINPGASAKFAMASATPGATIYYINDTSDPTDTNNYDVYTVPISDDTEPVESPANYYYKAVAYASGMHSVITTAAGIDFPGAIDLTGGGVISRNDVHTCSGIICSDGLLESVAMHRLWQVNGTIDLRDCTLLGGFYLPVGVVAGNILLNDSGFVGSVLIDFTNLVSLGDVDDIGTIDLSGSTFSELNLTGLRVGNVLAVDAALLEFVITASLMAGSVILTGCALSASSVDDIFNAISPSINEPDFDVSTIDLSGGTSDAPTGASATARAALALAGVSIAHN